MAKRKATKISSGNRRSKRLERQRQQAEGGRRTSDRSDGEAASSISQGTASNSNSSHQERGAQTLSRNAQARASRSFEGIVVDHEEHKIDGREENIDEEQQLGDTIEPTSDGELDYTYTDPVEEERHARFETMLDGEEEQLSQDYSYESDEEVLEGDAPVVTARRKYTLLGIFTTLADALVARDSVNDYNYAYDTRYLSTTTMGHIYKCVSHRNCHHRLKVKTLKVPEGDDRFQLWEGGRHGSEKGKSTKHGINRAVKGEVESMIAVGHGAQYILNFLEQKYFYDPEMIKVIPERRQIEKRKANLKKHLTGGWEITNNATFLAALHACFATIAQVVNLFNVSMADDDPLMDKMICIHVFYLGATAESPESFGAMFTSIRLLRNIMRSIRDQGGQLLCATDGTYKLHYGGWTVVDCGTEMVVWSRNEYVHRFVPWAYMFVRAERKEAYVEMLKALRVWAHELFQQDMVVAYASLDHSEAIASAFQEVWPRVVLLTCWPHLVRNTRSKQSLLNDATTYDTLIKPHLKLLRSARSHAQFIKMAVIVTDEWIACDERAFAEWFRSVYLTRRWERWHITAAGIGGVIPSQQGIEAYHGAIKKTCAPNRLASTSGVLAVILPKIVVDAGRNLCPTDIFHFGECTIAGFARSFIRVDICAAPGPVPPEMIMKANLLTKEKGNHKIIFQGRGESRRPVAVLFNSSRHMIGNGSPSPMPVSVYRATRFTNSLEGTVADGLHARELQFELCSLHRVTITRAKIVDPLQLAPVLSLDQVRRIREYLKCTCHSYARTGWACSHTLATLSLLDQLDLQSALSSVPVRKTPGRPPTRAPGLQRQDAHESYYARGRLLKKFLARPGLPLKWRVIDDADLNQDGEIETANFVGEVVSVRQSDGEFIWTARFDHDDLRDYDVEELTTAVARAYQLGVEIAL